MVSIKLILDKRRIKKDNSYPLNFHIHFNGKSTTRSTGISLKEDDWDDKNKLVRSTNPIYKAYNMRLAKDFADLQSKLNLSLLNRLTDTCMIQALLADCKSQPLI